MSGSHGGWMDHRSVASGGRAGGCMGSMGGMDQMSQRTHSPVPLNIVVLK